MTMETVSVPKHLLESMMSQMQKAIQVTEDAQKNMGGEEGYAYSCGYYLSVVSSQVSTLKAIIGEQLW